MWGVNVAEADGSSSLRVLTGGVALCHSQASEAGGSLDFFFLKDFSSSVNTFELWILVNT